MVRTAAVIFVLVSWAAAQGAYTPKFNGDPAHSNAEAAALGYMRTVLGAQREYKKKHVDYATSLAALVHSGSFTKRMTKTDRGDYTVHFRGTKDKFSLQMIPRVFDTDHRAFFADETGRIRVENEQPATAESPIAK
jgi:hypothetical protein